MKKRITSILLTLALAVAGLPAVNAAEISGDDIVVSEETQTTVEYNDVDALYSEEADDLYTFNVSEDGKAVGFDKVVYEDVEYLSADTVNALNKNAQDAYFEFVNEIAEAKSTGDELRDVVVAVDEAGTLVFQYFIPVEMLLAELYTLPEIVEDEALTEEAAATEILTEEIAAEENLIEITEDSTEKETKINEEEASETEIFETETFEIEITETETDETDTAECDTQEISEKYTFTAENMELLSIPKTEKFPAVETVKAEQILDLGYNSSTQIQQLYSILPSDDWFYTQLTDNQKTVYDAAEEMLEGTNTFTFSAAGSLTKTDICQAISAVIMTNPYQCDWMDLSSTGELGITTSYYSESNPEYEFSVTVGKSEYYNLSLNEQANARILELAATAQTYALQNYPNAPVYGIVKYFDQWICENNYYNSIGVSGSTATDEDTREIYYYCHSSYGVLLKGYGVCESYALTMTRLLDALDIPNMYATGQASDSSGNSGGHAWNYIQMPDTNWYLQDSTWNDSSIAGVSTEKYLLCADDGYHNPMGNRYKTYDKVFEFVTPYYADYQLSDEAIVLSKTRINLMPAETETLTYSGAYESDNSIAKTWRSSNTDVATVDKNGTVTAMAAGTAEITLTVAGITAACTVNVHQLSKTEITLFPAETEMLIYHGAYEDNVIKIWESSNTDVATVDENGTITAVAAGTAEIMLTVSDMTIACMVVVHKIPSIASITFDKGGGESLTAFCGIDAERREIQQYTLTVNYAEEVSAYAAEELIGRGIYNAPVVTVSNEAVATAICTVRGDTLELAVTPIETGNAEITVGFGESEATLHFIVEPIMLSKTELNLQLRQTEILTYRGAYENDDSVTKTWTSSNPRVAKVDKNGKVTAVAAGTAEIVFTVADMTVTCTVNVHQINSLIFDDGGKTSLTSSCEIDVSTKEKETQHIFLTVNQKAEKPVYTAEQLLAKGVFDDFKPVSSDPSVATVTATVTEDKIDLSIKPVAKGKTKITVTFGTKKATLTFSVSEKLDESWFDLKEVNALVNGTNPYTGKAYKPKVVLTDAGKAKKVKFKVTYKNNKDAGTAEVSITGTGSFGGSIIKTFEIQPLPLNVDTASLKISKPSNVYNGGINQTKSTVKNINTVDGKTKKAGLKAGKDYDIEYTKGAVTTTEPTEVGTYRMKIVGKGNYTGTHAVSDTYTITENDISKVKVTVKIDKAAPTKPVVEVKIGKNVLPSTDYKMTFYSDKDCTKSVNSFSAKTQYFVKVEAAGSNITDSKNKPIVKSFKTK